MASVSGCMSSVTSSAWRESTPSSSSTGASFSTSCHAEPSRSCTHIPARSLASASLRSTVSWSESTPAADVGVQAMVVPAVQAPVPGHRQPRVEHGADHLVGRRIRLDDAGHVHHLPQAGDALPPQRLADVVGRDRRPGVLEAGQRRHAGRDGEQHLELQPAALLEHPADAVEPEDVGDLVVVDEHGRGAVRQDRLGEARDGHHRRLDVHVRVDEPGHEKGAVGVEHARLRPARVGGVAEHRDPPRLDRDVDAVEHLARVDVDQAPAGDERGRRARGPCRRPTACG